MIKMLRFKKKVIFVKYYYFKIYNKIIVKLMMFVMERWGY